MQPGRKPPPTAARSAAAFLTHGFSPARAARWTNPALVRRHEHPLAGEQWASQTSTLGQAPAPPAPGAFAHPAPPARPDVNAISVPYRPGSKRAADTANAAGQPQNAALCTTITAVPCAPQARCLISPRLSPWIDDARKGGCHRPPLVSAVKGPGWTTRPAASFQFPA